jgi:hypothetical protein
MAIDPPTLFEKPPVVGYSSMQARQLLYGETLIQRRACSGLAPMALVYGAKARTASELGPKAPTLSECIARAVTTSR